MEENQSITAREFLLNTFNTDFLSDEEKETIITAMELYAMGKCREMRQTCSRMISGWPDQILTESEMEERISNAPLPKFENIPA